MSYPAYDTWKADQTPENLGHALRELDPVLVSEVQRYSGPKDILHVKAKGLAIKAIRSYDPTKGAALRSWVTTQLQPLSRYGQRLQSVRVPETVRRQAAEVHTISERLHDKFGRMPTDTELADEAGLSITKIHSLQNRVRPALTESQMVAPKDGVEGTLPASQFPSGADYAFEAVYQDLGPREKVIADWKIGAHGKERLPNQEIARRLGVSPALITQITGRLVANIQEVARHGV
jgi:DNA-directed RNA polymerase specialized sigma subunit